MSYRPDPAILTLGGAFYDPVSAADFPKTILRYRDERAAASIGLSGMTQQEFAAHFGRFKPLADNLTTPLALRYHGHQFRHYNPDIGDGRGFLFAQMRDAQGRLLDLGTKGSGQTPFSRKGDGRLTLLGGVREVLATRYLETLGVNTSKTYALIETGEALERHDEPSPTRAAVLTRLSHSHIRFGTFQRHYFENNAENLEKLTQYCLTHFYPLAEQTPAGLLRVVCEASAKTVASWMAAGFVHGVMNTDNMNITGESFDYGPYRFLPTLKPDFTAAYFDHQGLYAFARQPETMYWNLAQLTQCLSLIEDDQRLLEAMQSFEPHYRQAVVDAMLGRLGVAASNQKERDQAFVLKTFEMLEKTQAGWPQFFHDFRGGAGRLAASHKGPNEESYKHPDFSDWLAVFKTYTPSAPPPKTEIPAALIYEQIGALWAPIDQHDDWSAFNAKLASFELASFELA